MSNESDSNLEHGNPHTTEITELRDQSHESEATLDFTPEESPEEQTRKRFEQNLKQLNDEAIVFLEQAAVLFKLESTEKTTGESDNTNEVEHTHTPPVGKPLTSLERAYLDIRLRFIGIAHRDRLLDTADYLQTTRQDRKHRTIRGVPPKQVDNIVQKHRKQGDEVLITEPVSDDKDKRVNISVTKVTPYKFSLEDAQKYALITEKIEDPVAFFQTIEAVGLTYDRIDYDNASEKLQALAESPETMQLLENLVQLGVTLKTDYYGHSHLRDLNVESLIGTARQFGDRSTLPQPVVPLSELIGKISVNEIPTFFYVIEHESAQRLVTKLSTHLQEEMKHREIPLLDLVRQIDKAGLSEELCALYDHTIEVPNNIFRKQIDFSGADTPSVLEQIRSYIQLESTQTLLADEPLLTAATNVALLTDTKVKPRDVPLYSEVQDSPHGLALLYLLRQWCSNPEVGEDEQNISQLWNRDFPSIKRILDDKTLLMQITEPDFNNFVMAIKETGYPFKVDDISPKYSSNTRGRLLDLYEDPQARSFIISPAGREIIQIAGSLKVEDIPFYQKISELPDGPDLLRNLKSAYNITISNLKESYSTAIPEILTELSQDSELKAAAFAPETVTLYRQLKETLPFRFDHYYIKDLVALAKNHEAQQKILNPTNAEFIHTLRKQSFDSYSIRDIEAFTLIPNEQRSFLFKLVKTFKYRVRADGREKIHHQTAIEAYATNPELQAQLFEPERVALINRILKFHDFSYSFNPEDIEALVELPLTVMDFVEQFRDRANITFNYEYPNKFKLTDLETIAQLEQHNDRLFALVDQVKAHGLRFTYNLAEIDDIITLCQQSPDALVRNYAFLSRYTDEHNYPTFSVKRALGIIELIEKQYTEADLHDLIRILNHYNKDNYFTLYHVPNLIYLRENEQVVQHTVNELTQLGTNAGKHGYFQNMDEIKRICQDDTLEELRELKHYFPDYSYPIYSVQAPVTNRETGEHGMIPVNRPYERLIYEGTLGSIPRRLEQLGKAEEVPNLFTQAILATVERKSGITLTQENNEQFHRAITTLVNEVYKQTSDPVLQEFFGDERMLHYLLDHPERADDVASMKNDPLLHDMRTGSHILNNIDHMVGRTPEQREQCMTVIQKIDQSPSQEIQKVKTQLIEQLMVTNDPVRSYERIERVFVRNNLPLAGKVYSVFAILHSPEILDQVLEKPILSRVLRQASERRRYYTIYQDLLKIHLLSANRSLREYLEIMQSGQSLLDVIEQEGLESLNDEDLQQCRYFVNHLTTLYDNSQLGRHSEATIPSLSRDASIEDIQQNLVILKESLHVRDDQTMNQRLAEMFLEPIGVTSCEEALETMRHTKQTAHERALHYVTEATDGQLAIESGALIKGVRVEYIANILQNGSVAKEFLGASADSDLTPLDTDVSRVTEEDAQSGFRHAVTESLAKGYGDLLFVVKDRGQFQLTNEQTDTPARYNPDKLELFRTGAIGEKHYGIRTGFPTTEIDFMIAEPELLEDNRSLEKLYVEIAQNGYYIPVVDSSGTVIFTPELYQHYRAAFNGLDRFDAEPITVLTTQEHEPHYEQIQTLKTEIERDREHVDSLYRKIHTTIAEVLLEEGIILKEKFDRSLLGAELTDSGSTGRHTNKAGDYDFDLSLRLDDSDMKKYLHIVEKIMDRLQPEENNSHYEANRQYYQLRAIGATTIADTPIDIDIGITRKSELAVFASHNAVQEKLESIERTNGQEAYLETVANIVLAKKVLTDAQAYKKEDHGGWGGIGTETWILANNGNFNRACETFWIAAHEEDGSIRSLEEFRKYYSVIDAGINIKGNYHDNYVFKLKEPGYTAMLQAIENFRTGVAT